MYNIPNNEIDRDREREMEMKTEGGGEMEMKREKEGCGEMDIILSYPQPVNSWRSNGVREICHSSSTVGLLQHSYHSISNGNPQYLKQ